MGEMVLKPESLIFLKVINNPRISELKREREIREVMVKKGIREHSANPCRVSVTAINK